MIKNIGKNQRKCSSCSQPGHRKDNIICPNHAENLLTKSRKRTGEITQTTAKNVRLNSESTLQSETVNWTEVESLMLKNKSKSEEGFGFTEFEKYDEDVLKVLERNKNRGKRNEFGENFEEILKNSRKPNKI